MPSSRIASSQATTSPGTLAAPWSFSVQFLQDKSPIWLRDFLEHPLDHTTAVWMHRKRAHLSPERLDDELDVLHRHPFNGLLDDVVAILVFDASHNILFELLDQHCLLVR